MVLENLMIFKKIKGAVDVKNPLIAGPILIVVGGVGIFLGCKFEEINFFVDFGYAIFCIGIMLVFFAFAKRLNLL